MKNILNSINITINDQNYTLDLENSAFFFNVHRKYNSFCFEAVDKAIYTLSSNAFAVFVCMLRNTQDRAWRYTLKTINRKTNMSESDIFASILELIATEYLSPIIPEDGSNRITTFDLWENPDMRITYAA